MMTETNNAAQEPQQDAGQWHIAPHLNAPGRIASPTGETWPVYGAESLLKAIETDLEARLREAEQQLAEQARTFLAMQKTSEVTWRGQLSEAEGKAARYETALRKIVRAQRSTDPRYMLHPVTNYSNHLIGEECFICAILTEHDALGGKS